VPLQSSWTSPPPARPLSGTPPPKRRRVVRKPCGSAFREVLAPVDTVTRGALLRREPPRGSPCGTRAATLSSVPSSGFLPLSTVPAGSRLARSLLDPADRREPPLLRGLVSCRSRHWSFPTELSLPEEPYPLSRASFFLAGSRSTAAGAVPAGASRSISPVATTLCPVRPTRRRAPQWTHEPGRRIPSIARPVASAHS